MVHLPAFHPLVRQWFSRRFAEPTLPQRLGWTEIAAGRNTLISAPTGSGKTLAALLWAIDTLLRRGLEGPLPAKTSVLYVSPLRSLGRDIERNLQEPLSEIARDVAAAGLGDLQIRTAVRNSDTPPGTRAASLKRPPQILVTTPESLYIMLTGDRGRQVLANVETVIIDEIHAFVGDKRGSHLALSLERLDHLCRNEGNGKAPLRIGLSATQRPITEVARFLVGAGRLDPQGAPDCSIVEVGEHRALDIRLELPSSPLETIMSTEVWEEVYDKIADLVRQHRTTLLFVNTRRQAERLSRHLSERLEEGRVAAHHGSLSRDVRLRVEQRLRHGELHAVVATASLELGIDIGSIDLVCQIGSPRSVSIMLQRGGRAEHHVGGIPKVRLFPLNRDDLVECTALLTAIAEGELEELEIPPQPLDILAQQIVACCAMEIWDEEQLYTLVRGAYPYRNLSRQKFDEVVGMLSEGFASETGRRGAYLHRDAVQGRLRGRRGAKLTAITCGGAIPDVADYDVVLDDGTVVGSVGEDFAVDSMPGDIFQLGNTSWQILKIERGRVRVQDASGRAPSLPFWFGESPGRTPALSRAVANLREAFARALAETPSVGGTSAPSEHCMLAWMQSRWGVSREAAEQLFDYLGSGLAALGTMPSQRTVVAERFFDDAGGMQLILHAPFGTRVNRAWGLALRKRFCQHFNFELQAAANDDTIVLSLGAVHSFPLADVFTFLHPNTVRELLVQALLDAPMFVVRWRWNACRSFAVPRGHAGRKLAPQILRMRTEDLLTLVFPDQVTCLENIAGPRVVPDHPLVEQTVTDCLTEAMDIARLEALLRDMQSGHVNMVARDLTEPSPFALGVVGARPWAFLDDAPAEERRVRAVSSRRFLDPESAAELANVDHESIAKVRREAWPEVRDHEELHDALLTIGALEERDLMAAPTSTGEQSWFDLLAPLCEQKRVRVIEVARCRFWTTTERYDSLAPAYAAIPEDAAVDALLRGRLEVCGPVSVVDLSRSLALAPATIDASLMRFEAEGWVVRGRFGSLSAVEHWCERGLLARIHHNTLQRLRSEIDPVPVTSFIRFLHGWHGLGVKQADGSAALRTALERLEGYAAPAHAWEAELWPRRVPHFCTDVLERHSSTGRLVWLTLPPAESDPAASLTRRPVTFVARRDLALWAALWNQKANPTTVSTTPRTSPDATRLRTELAASGAVFFDDLVAGLRWTPDRVVEAIVDLACAGEVTSDNVAGLRAVLTASRGLTCSVQETQSAQEAFAAAGRWWLVPRVPEASGHSSEPIDERALEHFARVLLRRWGVVLRPLLARERWSVPWSRLVRVLRRLEARGEVRGGRFIQGCAGEQYALPEAVSELRKAHRRASEGDPVFVPAVDPLNLTGLLDTQAKVPATAGIEIVYVEGRAVAEIRKQELSWLATPHPELEVRVSARLRGQPSAPPTWTTWRRQPRSRVLR